MRGFKPCPSPSIHNSGAGRFWIIHAVIPFCILLGLIILFETTNLDLRLTDAFYDPATGKFPAKKSFWAETLIHKGGRNLIVAIGVACIGTFLASYRLPRMRPLRRAALYMALCIAMGTGSVAIVKQAINRHAPWGYDRYGGKTPYTALLVRPPAGTPVGHDVPAGHASGGFALMGGYFVLRGGSRRWAMAALAGGFAIGAVFAVGQQVRGAHFASHNLYTIALCWFPALALYRFMFPGCYTPAMTSTVASGRLVGTRFRAGWPGWVLGVGSFILLLGLLGEPAVSRSQEARVLVTAREMLGGTLQDYLIPHCNGEVRLHKPPLAYWLAAGSFGVFGVHDWAGRLPMALAAWGTILCTYAIGRRLVGARAALLGCLLLLGSLHFFRYGRLAETDILVTLFNTLAVGAILMGWRHEGRRRALAWHSVSGIAIGLAVMSKGLPAVYPLLFLVLLAWWTGRWRVLTDWLRSGAIALALLVALPWFIYVMRTPEWSRVPHEAYKVLRGGGHFELPGAHLVYLAKASLPWTPLVILALVAAGRQLRSSLRVRILLAWVLSVLVPLEIALQKQEHYLLPLMPGLMLLSAWMLVRPGRERWITDIGRIMLWGLAVVCAAAVVAMPAVGWRVRQGLSPADALVAIIAAGAAGLLIVQLRRGGYARALWTGAIAGTLLLSASLGIWAPGLVRDDFDEVAAEIREHYPHEKLAIYGKDMLPLSFYMRQVIPNYETSADLRRAWAERRFTLIVAEEDQVARLQWPAEVPLAQRWHFEVAGEHVVVRGDAD